MEMRARQAAGVYNGEAVTADRLIKAAARELRRYKLYELVVKMRTAAPSAKMARREIYSTTDFGDYVVASKWKKSKVRLA
jgi:hypothetical protein